MYSSTIQGTVTEHNCWTGALLIEAVVATLQHHDELIHGTTSTNLADSYHLSATNAPRMLSWVDTASQQLRKGAI